MRTFLSATGSVCLGMGLSLSLGGQVAVAGSALSFDGVNDSVSIGLGLFPNVTNTFTIEVWANPTAARAATPEGTSGFPGTSGQRYAIFPDYGRQAYGSDAHAGAGISIGTNGVSVFELTGSYLPSPLVYSINVSGWTHFAVTYSNGLPRLYVAGTLVRTGLISGRLVHPSADLGDAGYGFGFFQGMLDEVRVWNVALSAATLQSWLNREVDSSHPAYGNLIGYWQLNEGVGTTTVDSTSNDHSGVLRNGTTWVVPGALPGEPFSQTAPATGVTTNSAILNGAVSLSSLGATAWFEWGSGSATNRTPLQYVEDLHATNVIAQLLTDLPSSSFFSYRCVASNAAGMAFGALIPFTTTGPPVVTTLPPTSLVSTSVVLHGSVNPFGFGTTTWFEWGTNTSYGNRTTPQNVGSGFTTVSVSDTLTNLLAVLKYHYRLAASNAVGLAFGTDQTFIGPAFSLIFAPVGGLYEGAVAWGDYDRDGDLDLLVTGTRGTNGTSGVFRNDQAAFTLIWGTWYVPPGVGASFPHVSSGSAIWSDLDNDGALDLLLTGDRDYSYGQTAQVWRNSNGLFTNVTDLTGVGRSAAVAGDYDNDGYVDILLTGNMAFSSLPANPTNILYHNNGDGTFTNVQAGLPAVFESAVAWGDYDNDGQLDLLIAGDTGSGLIARVYHNNTGTFTVIGADLLGVASGSVAWGDYDGDGWLDILLGGSTNSLASGSVCKIYRNNHDGTFTDIGANLPGVYEGTAAWGDYDNDGQLDILLTGASPARVFRNDHGVFTDIAAGLPAVVSGAAAWGDCDGDGMFDVAINGSSFVGWSYASLQVFRNFLPVTNIPPNPPTAPGGLFTSVLNNKVTIRWDAASDAHTPTAGLTYNVRLGTTPGGGQIVPPHSDPVTGQRRLPQMGNAEHRLFSMVTNLSVGLYYWSVQSVNNSFVGSPWAPEQTFAVTSGPPVVVTRPASNVLCCSALLNGSVTPGGFTTRAWFEWGTNSNLGNATPPLELGTGLLPQLVQQTLPDLQPRTTYFLRLMATNSAGLALGTNQQFTTEGPAPTVATLTSSNVNYTGAALFGTSPLSSPSADYFIEWGTTPAYGHLTPAAIIDAALRFDGVDDCVAVGWGKFPNVTNNFTMELWVNPTAARAETVESVGGIAGWGGQRYAVFPEQGNVAYGAGSHAGAGLSVGTNGVSVMECADNYIPTVMVYSNSVSGWTHIALVYSNHVPKLFVNATLARTGLISTKVVHPSAGLGGVAENPWNSFGPFAGEIQDVRIWDVPLDAPTIQAWMNQNVTTNHPAYSHLQGYWPLNEGRGPTAADGTPFNNTVQLLNGTYWTGGHQSTARVFRAVLDGLSPDTTYHFRAVATNPGGTAYGADQTFTTLPLPRVLGVTVQTAPATAGSLLRFSGSPGFGYVMETSTNLVDWLALTNLVAGSDGLFEFLDTSATNFPTRFYRLRVP